MPESASHENNFEIVEGHAKDLPSSMVYPNFINLHWAYWGYLGMIYDWVYHINI